MENKEKHIINQISNHREAVDTDELWANISSEIPHQEEKKKRGIIWFWAGLSCFMIASLLGYIMIDNPIKDRRLEERDKENNNLQETISQIADLSKTKKDKTENATYKSVINSNPELKKENSSSIILTDLKKNEKLVERQIDYNVKSIDESKQSEIKLLDNKSSKISEQSIQKDFIEGVVDIEHVELTYNNPETIYGEARVIIIIDELTRIPPIGLRLLDFQRNNLNIEKKAYVTVDLQTEKTNKVARWSALLNTGISAITRQLKTSDTEFLDQRNRRDLTEKVIGGWDVTAGLTYQINPSIGISTGVTFGQIYEQATYTTSYQLETQEESVTTLIHTQDGSVNTLSGTVSNYTNRQTNEVRNNTFRYFSIPAIVKYRLLENETYSLNLNGNIAYTFSQKYSGFISLDENEPAYELTSDVLNDFARSGGLSFGFGLEAGRRISQNWDMNIGVGMRYLQGISSNTNLLEQKYKLYNLSFGISRKI